MVFSSVVFLFLFLPVVLTAYHVTPHRLRGLLLLLSSVLFYAWGEAQYVGVILASILANWVFGLLIGAAARPRVRRGWLLAAVAFNLGLLAWFKYANFVAANLGVALDPVHLPLGISFFTFQAIGYVIDVYRGDVAPQRGLLTFGLYKTFFPQLVAGPIVRYADVAEQLARPAVTLDRFAYGVQRFIGGLAKKVLIANVVGKVADQIFALPTADLTAGVAWLGVVCYALQIYFDFSGYSDMAVGLAALFGLTFPENFNYPYTAASVQDFWRRWHLSLSSFFRDYVYIPLGGSRGGTARTCFNLVVVFFLCGLWHGASWTFVVWGLFHGAFLTAERFGLGRLVGRLPAPLRHAYTLAVVCVGWVFFRADSLAQAGGFLAAMAGLGTGDALAHFPAVYLSGEVWLVLLVGTVAATPALAVLGRRVVAAGEGAGRRLLRPVVPAAAVAGLFGLFFVSVVRLSAGGHNPFIYYRF